MANSYTEYTIQNNASIATVYTTPIYRVTKSATDLLVYVDGVRLTEGVDYSVSDTSLNFTAAGLPTAGKALKIVRNTEQSVAPDSFSDASYLYATDLNDLATKTFYMAQEALDLALETNLGAVTFYNSTSIAPANPALGDLWYDTTVLKLKVYDGTIWTSAVEGSEILTFTAWTNEGDYSYVPVPNLSSASLVFLNGIKLERGTEKADLIAATPTDYWIDEVNDRVYFATLTSGDTVSILKTAPTIVVISGTAGEVPSNPPVGTSFFLTTTGKPIWWTGTTWLYADGTSAGI